MRCLRRAKIGDEIEMDANAKRTRWGIFWEILDFFEKNIFCDFFEIIENRLRRRRRNLL